MIMMRRLSLFLFTIFLWKESLQAASSSCYFPDGTFAPNDRPCYPDKANSQCCAVGHSCMSNNLCRWPDEDMPYPLVYIRGSCTDQTWTSPDCSQQCQNVFPNQWDEIYACSNGEFCCELQDVSGDGCCSPASTTGPPLFDLAPGTTVTVISATSWGTSIISGNTLTTASSSAAQTSVPSLVLETISYGPLMTTPTHSPIPSYTGSGSLLQGYCNTPNYVLLDGPTAYWAPVVGCNLDKVDCCPYSVAQQTDTTAGTGTTVTVISTVTVDVGPAGATQSVYTGLNDYPVPVSANQASLQHCPDDYQTVSGGCCPSGYQLWNAVLGGQVPCYSSVGQYLSPPAVPTYDYEPPVSIPPSALASRTSTTSSSAKPTFAVVNVVYAVQYPLASTQDLSTGAKAGIGAGAGVGALVIIGLAGALIWRTRKHNKDKKALAVAQAAAPGSTAGLGTTGGPGSTAGQSQNFMSSVSPQQFVQTPSSFVPQEAYFPPPQMQQMQHGYPQQNYYGQQPAQHIQEGQLQPAVQYPSPPPPSVSPPSLDGGYSHQGGYPPPGSASGYAPSSTGSQAPAPQAYGYQPNCAPSEITRQLVPQQVLQQQQIQQGQRQELHSHGQNNLTELGT